jgi:integrase
VNNYITHLSAVWYHLTGEERIYTGINPFKSIRKLKIESAPPKDRPWADVEAVVEEAALHGSNIHKAFVLTHLFGIRKVEMLRVRHSDIDWKRRTITFHKTKPRKKTYTVHMPPEAVEALMKYRQPGDAYFVKPESAAWPEDVEYRWHFRTAWQTVFRSLNAKREAASIPKVEPFSPHQLRHTLITRLVSLGWPLQDVAAFVDQDEVTVTAKYGRQGPDLRRETLRVNTRDTRDAADRR